MPPPKSIPLICNLVVQDLFFYFCTTSSDSTQVVPRFSLRIVAICGAYKWPKFSIYPPGEISFFASLLISIPTIDFVSGWFSPQMLRCFHKPTTNLLFSLLVFQQLCSNLLARMLSKFNCGRSCHFLLRSLYHNDLVSILSFRSHCDAALFTHLLVLSRSCPFRVYPLNRSVVSTYLGKF